MDYFAARAEAIRAWLGAYMERAEASFSALAPLGPEACRRLLDFTRPGKLIRGGLVSLGRDLWGEAPARGDDPAIAAGAAMELVQSAFLIHDDIMDRDQVRRGSPSFHWRYRTEALGKGVDDPLHYGESMGICGGDAALFLAFSILGSEGIPRGVAALCGREFAAVAFGQMLDVQAGAVPDMPSEEEILRTYTWKTGRYSFSLPLSVGAMIAGRTSSDISALEGLGEALGRAFQMRDDELGLFGDPAETGKPRGSDLREGKKTLLLVKALAVLEGRDREDLLAVLGRSDADDASLSRAVSLVEASGARVALAERMAAEVSCAKAAAKGLSGASPEAVAVLGGLADFCVERRK